MLKVVKELTSNYLECNKKIGNHKRIINNKDNSIDFIYHSTIICKLFPSFKKIIINNGGWNTSSTTRTINSYKEIFNNYEVIDLRK